MKPAQAILALVVVVGCGPTVIRTYSGPELRPGQSSSLWSNEHMSILVDHKYSAPVDEGARRGLFAMTPGHHVVKLSCLFTDDVQYQQLDGTRGGAPIIDRSLGGPGQVGFRAAGAPSQTSAMLTGSPPPSQQPPMRSIEWIRSSRPRLFALDAAPGHSYLPRARFTRDAGGQPACDVRIDDITDEKDGHKVETF
jgi:hypothetical protein